MWCHVFRVQPMPPSHSKHLREQLKRRLAIAACAALLVLAAVPTVASARSSIFDVGSETSLSFVRETAELVGPDALVLVRCNGSAGDTCSGTLTLSFSGSSHKAPFSILAGTSQSVSVSVRGADRLAGRRAVAVARTTQPTGRFARSSEVLRFR
jgi:hypothetical protein